MRSFYACVLAIILLCSCSSQIPEPISYHYAQQKTMEASAHWQVLAADLANRINNQLIVTGFLDKAVFVKETCGDENSSCQANETNSFNEGFRDLLISNLFEYGIPTKSHPDKTTIEVRYKVQVVLHNSDHVHIGSPAASSQYEIIITTSMITNDQYLFRASDIYYINEKDFYQYQENMPQTKTIRLTRR